jgi:drug/metabolite transporter superfamily protein YnfA
LRLTPFLFYFTLVTSGAAADQGPFALLHSLFDPGTNVQADAEQGRSVAIDGNLAVVGAPSDDAAALDSGAVKVYDATSGALLHTLTKPNAARSDHFGASVAISGTRVLVGAPDDTASRWSSGGAYLFDLAGATPGVPVLTLTNPSPGDYNAFGAAVAISGTRLLIGDSTHDVSGMDTGAAYAYDLNSATPAIPMAVLVNPTPTVQGYFGHAVAMSGARAVVGTYRLDAGAQDAGGAYVYDLSSATPALTVATLVNPGPAAFDYFGLAVAISGTRVVIAAPNDDTGTNNAGSAYVYDLASPTPAVPVMTLTNPSPASVDQFGVAVAISGARVVVAGWWDDVGKVNVGRAYVYDLAGSSPKVPVATLTNPTPAQFDYFGHAAAISGTRVVIGAPFDDTSATNAGSAYTFDLAGADPAEPVATLDTTGLAGFHNFGDAVAISGRYVVVGAAHAPFNDPFFDKGASSGGNTYVYDLASAAPTVPMLTLTNPSPAAYDFFGWSLAVAGTTLVIGARNDSTGAQYAGSVYVYDLASPTPAAIVMTLTNPTPASGERFGYSVAMSGTRLVVGAAEAYQGASSVGSVYVFDLAGAAPTVPIATLTNPGPASGDYFGSTVAIDNTRVIVGAFFDDTGSSDAGSAYVYDLASATPTVPMFTLTNPTPENTDYFGYTVAISGTLALVGSPNDDTGMTNRGSVYVYDLAGTRPAVPITKLSNPSRTLDNGFDTTLAIHGTHVVIGAPTDDTGATNAGRVFIYDLAGATPNVPVATLNHPAPAYNDYFGSGVAVEGLTVVVGAPYQDMNGADRGAAYIFGIGPTLRIAPAASGLARISWTPATSSGFVLQYTDSLSPVNWLNAPSGAANPVTISTTNASRFYRLFQP